MNDGELGHSQTQARNWAVVVFLLVLSTATGLVFDPHISLTSQAMLYVLAVVIVSYLFAWKESVVCAVAAVTALNFFFVPPRWTFEVDSREHLIALFAMLLVALVISHLAARLRSETAAARINEHRARQLQRLTADLSVAGSSDAIVELGQAALNKSFDGPNVLVTCAPNGVLEAVPQVGNFMLDGMNCCIRVAAVLGPGTGRWPGLNAWYLPLGTKGRMNGAAFVQPALASDNSGREHAQALCALVGNALWRTRLASGMLAAQVEVQRQQIQNTFLAAISHDLRTPLAAVVGGRFVTADPARKTRCCRAESIVGKHRQRGDLLVDCYRKHLSVGTSVKFCGRVATRLGVDRGNRGRGVSPRAQAGSSATHQVCRAQGLATHQG